MSWVQDLDARQRAMLAEMGVRVWAPKAASAPSPVPATQPQPAAHATITAATIAAPARATAQARATAPGALADGRHAPTAAVPAAVNTLIDADRSAGDSVGAMDWPALRAAVAGCEACGLCRTRQRTVFGVGHERAPLMIVGEAPGEQEDRQGEPFVGAAGQLLDAMLRAVQRDRMATETERAVFIANVLKCRPPSNRNPQPDEVARCEPFLARQVALVQPRLILALGRFAVQSLLKTDKPIGQLRGRVHRYEGVPVVVSYHPAYLLRSPADKGKAWADLCLAMEQLDAPSA